MVRRVLREGWPSWLPICCFQEWGLKHVTVQLKPSVFKELRLTAALLAKPIDFNRLMSDDILRQKGDWYEVLDFDRLPEHARVKIRALRAPNLVKFRKPGKKLQKFVKRGY
jgi:hypothetical protein